jgi:uncharacterized membrane protein
MSVVATLSEVLVFVTLLAGSVWVGGFVAIAVAARVASRHLQPADRVAFFRALGRSYGVVGGLALAVALVGGAVLLADHGWDGAALSSVVAAAALVLVTAAGVRQARGMTRLRQRALRDGAGGPLSERVRDGARRAAFLRAAIALLSLVLLAHAAVLAA